jgi:hypothetical protein
MLGQKEEERRGEMMQGYDSKKALLAEIENTAVLFIYEF